MYEGYWTLMRVIKADIPGSVLAVLWQALAILQTYQGTNDAAVGRTYFEVALLIKVQSARSGGGHWVLSSPLSISKRR